MIVNDQILNLDFVLCLSGEDTTIWLKYGNYLESLINRGDICRCESVHKGIFLYFRNHETMQKFLLFFPKIFEKNSFDCYDLVELHMDMIKNDSNIPDDKIFQEISHVFTQESLVVITQMTPHPRIDLHFRSGIQLQKILEIFIENFAASLNQIPLPL